MPFHYLNHSAAKYHSLLTPIYSAYPLCVTQYAAQTSHFNPFCVLSSPLTLHASDIDRWSPAESNLKHTVTSAVLRRLTTGQTALSLYPNKVRQFRMVMMILMKRWLVVSLSNLSKRWWWRGGLGWISRLLVITLLKSWNATWRAGEQNEQMWQQLSRAWFVWFLSVLGHAGQPETTKHMLRYNYTSCWHI